MINKKILIIRKKLDKLDNLLLDIIKNRSSLVDKIVRNIKKISSIKNELIKY